MISEAEIDPAIANLVVGDYRSKDVQYAHEVDLATCRLYQLLQEQDIDFALTTVLPSARRICTFFDINTYPPVERVNDICLDMELMKQGNYTIDDVYRAIQQLQSIAWIYYPVAEKKAMREPYDQLPFGYDEAVFYAQERVERSIWKDMNVQSNDPLERTVEIHRHIIRRFRYLTEYLHRRQGTALPFITLESKDSAEDTLVTVDFEDQYYNDIMQSELVEELKQYPPHLYNIMFGFLAGLSPQELVEAGNKQEHVDEATEAYGRVLTERYRDYLESSRAAHLNQHESKQIYNQIRHIIKPYSLRQVLACVATFSTREKRAFLKRFGYYRENDTFLEVYDDLSMTRSTFVSDFARARDLLAERINGISADASVDIDELIRSADEGIVWRMNDRVVHHDSPRIIFATTEIGDDFKSKLSQSEIRVIMLARDHENGTFKYNNQEISRLTGLQEGRVEEIITTIYDFIKTGKPRYVDINETVLNSGLARFSLITLSKLGITPLQISNLSEAQYAYFVAATEEVEIDSELGVLKRFRSRAQIEEITGSTFQSHAANTSEALQDTDQLTELQHLFDSFNYVLKGSHSLTERETTFIGVVLSYFNNAKPMRSDRGKIDFARFAREAGFEKISQIYTIINKFKRWYDIAHKEQQDKL